VDFPNGRWMRTGDIVYCTYNGYFFIIDRMKDLIKVKGNQVAPAEIEVLLLVDPKLAEAYIVVVTIDGEEVPRADAQLKKSCKGEELEIQRWIEPRVSRFKRLRGGIAFVDEVPKNPVSLTTCQAELILILHSLARSCGES
jgi:4-coumarate--CoA ligase